jgi:hypothetical protein
MDQSAASSAESVVLDFLQSWVRFDPDELVGFFAVDAVYTDGPRAVHHGIDEIRTAFAEMSEVVPSTVADVQTMVSRSDPTGRSHGSTTIST